MALVGPRLGMTRSGCGMVCGMGKVRWSAARAATRRFRAKPATSQHGERDGERERGRHIVLICCPWFETYATQVQCCIIVLNDRLALCMDYGRPRLGMSNVVPHLKVWPVDGLWMRERERSVACHVEAKARRTSPRWSARTANARNARTGGARQLAS